MVYSGNGRGLLPVVAAVLTEPVVHQGIAEPGGLLGFGVHHFRDGILSQTAWKDEKMGWREKNTRQSRFVNE